MKKTKLISVLISDLSKPAETSSLQKNGSKETRKASKMPAQKRDYFLDILFLIWFRPIQTVIQIVTLPVDVSLFLSPKTKLQLTPGRLRHSFFT